MVSSTELDATTSCKLFPLLILPTLRHLCSQAFSIAWASFGPCLWMSLWT